MGLLKNPSEITETVLVKGLIFSRPTGIGKSTLALSAPNPVMIDSDKGMRRVEERFELRPLHRLDLPGYLCARIGDFFIEFRMNEL